MFNSNVNFLTEEFLIDEDPLDVFTEEVKPEQPEINGDEAPPNLAGHMFGGYHENDLISGMAALMVQQHQLIQKARIMESKKAGDDEFGRFAEELLPFLDNFNHVLDKAREHEGSQEIENWLKSVEALYYRITSLLDSFDFRFVSALGKPVDLDFQEVIEHRPTDQDQNDTVIHEVQRAAVLRGRLLREAKVVVACNEADEEDPGELEPDLPGSGNTGLSDEGSAAETTAKPVGQGGPDHPGRPDISVVDTGDDTTPPVETAPQDLMEDSVSENEAGKDDTCQKQEDQSGLKNKDGTDPFGFLS